MSEPTVIDPAKYWKMRTLLAELTCIQRDVAERQKDAKAAMVDAGLDPDANYQLDDANCAAKLAEG